jgi:hypothetical protein
MSGNSPFVFHIHLGMLYWHALGHKIYSSGNRGTNVQSAIGSLCCRCSCDGHYEWGHEPILSGSNALAIFGVLCCGALDGSYGFLNLDDRCFGAISFCFLPLWNETNSHTVEKNTNAPHFDTLTIFFRPCFQRPNNAKIFESTTSEREMFTIIFPEEPDDTKISLILVLGTEYLF